MFRFPLFFIFTLYLFFVFVKPQCDPTNVLTCPSGCCEDVITCSITFNISFMNPIQAGCYSINCDVVSCGTDYCCTNNGCQSGNCTAAASSSSNKSKFRIIGVVVLVVVILCCIGCCVYCIRRRMKRKLLREKEENNARIQPKQRYQQPANESGNFGASFQPAQPNYGYQNNFAAIE